VTDGRDHTRPRLLARCHAAGVPHTARLVLLTLATHEDGHGRAFPSHVRLCAETGLTRNPLRDAVRALERAGIVAVESVPHPHGGVHKRYTVVNTDDDGSPDAVFREASARVNSSPTRGSDSHPREGEQLTPKHSGKHA
jgi:hypothetical protein